VIPYLKDPSFYGASVTMPYKKEIIPYLDIVEGEAKAIGVVNLIVRFKDKLYGFNTDWYGICKPILKRLLKKREASTLTTYYQNSYALIYGAGATAQTALFCVKKMGMIPIIFNRTETNLKSFVKRLSKKQKNKNVHAYTDINKLIELLQKDTHLSLVISTVPGSSDLQIPKEIFKDNPIIFDVSYFPQETHFITEAKANGCTEII